MNMLIAGTETKQMVLVRVVKSGTDRKGWVG